MELVSSFVREKEFLRGDWNFMQICPKVREKFRKVCRRFYNQAGRKKVSKGRLVVKTPWDFHKSSFFGYQSSPSPSSVTQLISFYTIQVTYDSRC